MKKVLVLFTAAIIFMVLFTSCKDKDNPVDPGGLKTMTINHWGVDWSKGTVGGIDGDVDDADGETIGWCPNGSGGGSGVWYRAHSEKYYFVGTGSIDDISSINTTMWDNDICDKPLKKDDIWATEVNDGYVVFKVLEDPNPEDHNWSVKVQYKYSTSTNF